MSSPRYLTTRLPAGFGAGVASALLAMMPALKGGLAADGGMTSAGAAAWLFAFVAPLPIMLASISFGTLSGLLAALIGSLAVGLVALRPDAVAGLPLDRLASAGLVTLVFAICFGVPSWLLGRLAIIPSAGRPDAKPPQRPDERRLARIMGVAAGFAAIGAAIGIALVSDARGSFGAFLDTLAKAFEPAVSQRGPLPAGWDAHSLARVFAWWLLAAMAAGQLLTLTLNLWLAARISKISGLLNASWPDVPSNLRVPRQLALVLAVALGLTAAGNALGAVGVVVSGALGMAFALQGFAVVHALTRGNRGLRLPLLTLLYLILVAMMPFSIVPFGMLGLLDAAFSFRDRQKPTVKKTK